MSDIEKTPATPALTEAEVDTRQGSSKLFGIFKTQLNDPNELGKELLQKAFEYDEAQLERDAIKVRRKLDLMVLPMVGPSSGSTFHDDTADI